MRINSLRKYWFQIAGVLILCAIAFGVGWWVNKKTAAPGEELVQAAYRAIAGESIYNSRSQQELSYAGVRGMLDAIEDPYAELIEPQAAQNFLRTFRGKTGVVGLYTTNQDQQVVVAIVFPGSPAEKAGLRVGDVLVAIDGTELDQDTDSSEAGLLLRGEPGAPVQLTVRRAGVVETYTLTRQEQTFVTARMLPGEVGYITLSAYNQTASRQFRQALEAMLQQKPAGLVWDLRSNEGGDMQAAQEILSYLIEDGLLFTAEQTRDREVAFRAKGGALAADIPLVVLIDETTYSAAETCAAAVAETGRGTTIGSTTYGKGVIQATIPITDDTMLQMTVAKWRSAGGEWYQGRGVPPQIEVANDPGTQADEVLQRAVEILENQVSAAAADPQP
jgi:carboxyl-terminal processing protease